MSIESLHFLLTYECNFECDHCFVWGSPKNRGVMKLSQMAEILRQAKVAGVIRSIFFEGGEAFLYYPILLWGLTRAKELGFKTGVVTNAYWATSIEDAKEWLRPLLEAGVSSVAVSDDLYHFEKGERNAELARQAARELHFRLDTIAIESVQERNGSSEKKAASVDKIMFKGRAAEELASEVSLEHWEELRECPYEDFSNQKRVHVDPLGYIHVCQGIVIGNLFQKPLFEVLSEFLPSKHPICGPLLQGGPVELVQRYEVPHERTYADACHLCYSARVYLRDKFPEYLCPDQMYGIF